MFLKSLYISGFKSFANPTTIHFNEDVSAIVGPNGSGKSNISDAIRFVLGEQRTKQMRSHSMEDIIFSGTDVQGPRGLAEVKLVLEDEENPDLVIERKYYRTGESDYLLNGKKVRLKDIHSMFADTGLGKNGYSIISQGGVENIVGASPKELRELVEEAVGIAGYKVRQNETVKRLNSIQTNIERVLDVLEEMEKQLKPLKRQAEKAREYLKISNVLRDIDLVLFYDKEVEFKEKLEKLNNDLVESNFILMDLDKEASSNDKKYLESKTKLASIRDSIEELNTEINTIKGKINSFEKEISIKNNDLKNFKENFIRINTEIDSLKKNIVNSESKISSLKESSEKTNNTFNEILEKESNLLKEVKAIEDQNKKVNSSTIEIKLEKINESIDELKVNKIKIETEIENLKSNKEENLNRKDNLNDQLNELKLKRSEVNNNLSLLNEKSSKILKDLKEANNKLEDLNKNEQKLREEIVDVQNKKEYQIQIRNSYQGFNHSVRAIMSYSKKNNLKGVFGPVGDLFSTDPKYQTAIQVALGGSIQNIVVKNSKITQELINYLKSENKGRATFLPLDNINVNSFNLLNSPEGFIGTAFDLIKFDSKFQKVFERLLGRTLIFSDYITARNFRKVNKKNTLVTLEGECFYPSGAIVGGSFKKNFNQLLSPNQELNNLDRQEKNLIDKKNSLLKQKKCWINLVEKNSAKRENFLKSESECQKDFDSLNQRIQIIESELSKIKDNNELNYKEKQLNKVSDDLEHLEEQKEIFLKELNTNSKVISGLEEKLKELNSEVTEKRIEKNRIENQLNGYKERIHEIELSLNESKRNLENKTKEKEKLKKSSEFNRERIKELENEILSTNHSLNFKEKQLKSKKKEQKSLEEAQVYLEENIKNLNHTRIQEVEVKSKIERKIERIDLEKQSLETKIFDQYSENFNSVKEQIETLREKRLDIAESQVYEYKQKLKKIGTVNPNSIEDYYNLKERYTSLKENYEDLVEAKKDVENTIESLNQSMSEQFDEKFELLNDYFNKSFQTLFEGGKANLNLTNHENSLESGIELYAQPPGKKLKHINLLSGGEKAMTSIALLFAFLELNPAPFIIIDEIDAALDEANINRFTKYLKKIQEQNQFIIITHRKSTLSECNNIHGVSMASDGISRLCSIKLSDYIGE